jgi:16S rRNA (cytidine1402-2'-O)-methyltransferase
MESDKSTKSQEFSTFISKLTMASLYLIPNLLSEAPWQGVLPQPISEIVSNLRFFIVEDIRNARRFLKKIDPAIHIDGLTFFELNKFTTEIQKTEYLKPLTEGFDVGLLSEAGCPGVADPGADIVRLAHQCHGRVVPLVGPSSILLALMASGMNGQQFVFHGYLPVKQSERIKKIQQLEKQAFSLKQTQIFIETPYRNNQLMADILKTCQPTTLLCIAADLTSENEFIHTQRISDWKKQVPDLDKRPAIFLIGGGV